jgi:hypothetical protein
MILKKTKYKKPSILAYIVLGILFITTAVYILLHTSNQNYETNLTSSEKM